MSLFGKLVPKGDHWQATSINTCIFLSSTKRNLMKYETHCDYLLGGLVLYLTFSVVMMILMFDFLTHLIYTCTKSHCVMVSKQQTMGAYDRYKHYLLFQEISRVIQNKITPV